MRTKILLLIVIPITLFGGGTAEAHQYDIIPRIVNFIIFAGILYYFIANPIKNAYKNRISSISSNLESIQDKLRTSKAQKDEAIKKVEETKSNVKEFIQTAKKEIEILTDKIKKETQNEILFLEKSYKEQKELEERKMTKGVVSEILEEIFNDNSININQNELMNLVLKKVG